MGNKLKTPNVRDAGKDASLQNISNERTASRAGCGVRRDQHHPRWTDEWTAPRFTPRRRLRCCMRLSMARVVNANETAMVAKFSTPLSGLALMAVLPLHLVLLKILANCRLYSKPSSNGSNHWWSICDLHTKLMSCIIQSDGETNTYEYNNKPC